MHAETPSFSARANGKFLITGEYFVLDGAKAFAVPLKYGQDLKVYDQDESVLTWHSLNDKGEKWMSAEFDLNSLTLLDLSGDVQAAHKLEEIFQFIKVLNPSFLSNTQTGLFCEIRADFDLNWGLGSSSTFIWLLAKWAGIDAYKLQFECFGGSGYDIACAGATSPIVYQKWPQPHFHKVAFQPAFSDSLYLVYLEQKQNSRDAIAHYRSLNPGSRDEVIDELNSITKQLLEEPLNLDECINLFTEHERIMGNALQTMPVQERLFPDFNGVVKSMGAWGGDFVLVASNLDEENTRAYFSQKGYSVTKKWDEMVL